MKGWGWFNLVGMGKLGGMGVGGGVGGMGSMGLSQIGMPGMLSIIMYYLMVMVQHSKGSSLIS